MNTIYNDTLSLRGFLIKKKWLLSLFALLLLVSPASFLSAQDRITVEPDNFPLEVGALNRAIETNGGDVIYVLRNGKSYFVDARLDYEHDLHFEAEEYPSDNPPIIRPASDLFGNAQHIGSYSRNGTFKGLFFYGIADFGAKVQTQRPQGEDARYVYKHCYFMGGGNYMFRVNAINQTYRIEDSQVANIGRASSATNQRFFDTRGINVDSLIVINTSIYNVFHSIIRPDGAKINYIYFDHVTMANTYLGNWSVNVHTADEVVIKNCLFRNIALDGSWESEELVGDAGPGYDGERYYSDAGFIRIASFDDMGIGRDEDRRIVIKNNNFGGLPDQVYLDIWEDFSIHDPVNNPVEGRGDIPWGTDPQWLWDNPDITPNDPVWATRDTIKLTRIMTAPLDSILTAWERNNVSWATIENNMHESVDFNDPPDDLEDYIRIRWYGGEKPRHYDRADEIFASPNTRYYHPAPGDPVNTTANTAAWFRDLSYSTASNSYTYAENGFPLGNLNFFPDKRRQWGEQQANYASGETLPATDFRLIGNYPNPFNPTTNIVFEVANRAEITLEVFNVLGQNMATLDLGLKEAGRHEVSFDAAHLSSGVYLIKMQSGNQVQTHRISLVK